jgi:hypothetical protein
LLDDTYGLIEGLAGQLILDKKSLSDLHLNHSMSLLVLQKANCCPYRSLGMPWRHIEMDSRRFLVEEDLGRSRHHRPRRLHWHLGMRLEDSCIVQAQLQHVLRVREELETLVRHDGIWMIVKVCVP